MVPRNVEDIPSHDLIIETYVRDMASIKILLMLIFAGKHQRITRFMSDLRSEFLPQMRNNMESFRGHAKYAKRIIAITLSTLVRNSMFNR
jgi:hypothetical protein